jgi:hypothetical protein
LPRNRLVLALNRALRSKELRKEGGGWISMAAKTHRAPAG